MAENVTLRQKLSFISLRELRRVFHSKVVDTEEKIPPLKQKQTLIKTLIENIPTEELKTLVDTHLKQSK